MIPFSFVKIVRDIPIEACGYGYGYSRPNVSFMSCFVKWVNYGMKARFI